jgi:DNA-binding response OmpR family regulator
MSDTPRLKKVVLVVDDDLALCRIMSSALMAAGYEAPVANDGPQAIEKFQSLKPDLVLLDFAMPGMNGYDVVNELRRLEANTGKRTLIILLTAYSQTYLVSLGFRVDADSYIGKPVMPSDLVAQVRDLLVVRG